MMEVFVGYSPSKETESIQNIRDFRKVLESTSVDAAKMTDYLSTTIIGRVRRNFMQQVNPDGKKWKMTRAAKIRLSGGKTFAKGGKFAPGGYKTGGNILFSSGNLFHSIQLTKETSTRHVVRTDVSYAQYYQNERYTIIGVQPDFVENIAKQLLGRLGSG